MIDQKTPNQQYKLPHIQNTGAEEVARLRDTVTAIDNDVAALNVGLANKASKATTDNLQAQIDDLSILIFAGLI
ncbi:MAG: hypothetical protein HY254_03445 [Burkholderiales bacterium]|nr:hypothetical protein [Burkholderiales bacterium]